MADPGPENDPYTIRPGARVVDSSSREGGRRDASPPPAGAGAEPPRIDDQTLRRVRRLILISALAPITAVFLPPLGLAIGIFAAVLVWRWWSALVTPGLTRATVVVVVFGTVFAIVVGGVGTVLAGMFASEIADYANCQTGANTHLARDKCWAEFTEAIEDRLIGP